ncbi:hypothetical protein L7F22_045728 [Adiantum nelumboides]|nr:hypothetical protein [Adiantum nelumboides]MCO5591736.1 hypothetical protein [Adiantum nelumboides]
MSTAARNCSRKAALAILRSAGSIPAAHTIHHSSLLPARRLPSPQQYLPNNASCSSSRPNATASALSHLLIRQAPPVRHFAGAAKLAEHDSSVAEPRGEVSEYWGVVPKQIQREDGSPWPWNSFRPADTYTADVAIDVNRHYPAQRSWVDRAAYWTVRALRGPVDFFFKERHVSHALLLETVAAVPGMVGGMLLHLRSLRRFEYSGGWIKALLDEAENERMHLMTWVEVLRPAWWERALVLAVQGTFFNAYFLLYLASPRLAHRFVGYLEEEAVRSYSDFLHAIDVGHTPNGPAPLIAIDYWRLRADATVRDVVLVVRADEAHHRDVNHFAADVYNEKRELRTSPAPIGYH